MGASEPTPSLQEEREISFDDFFDISFTAIPHNNPCSAPILFMKKVCLFRLSSNVVMHQSVEGEENGYSIQP
eukprot:2618910-Prymnesium_polylepis.1